VQFDVLGPFEVRAGQRLLELGSPKQRAVLAMLTLEANTVVSVDRLVDQLWGDEPPGRPAGSLHAYVSNLRRVLEPDRAARAPAQMLISRDPGYLLVVQPDQLDALLFEDQVAAGSALLHEGRAADAVRVLDGALSLWRGPVLADFAYETFVAPTAHRLEQLRRSAAEDRAEAMIALGRCAAAIVDLEELVLEDPLRERTWSQLMVALYRDGRQADALRTYQRARTALIEELGIEPGPELQQLERAVLDQVAELQLPASGPASAVVARPRVDRSSSASRTALVGRDKELSAIDDALTSLSEGHGLVVVVSGEPGVGKSALLSELVGRATVRGFASGMAQSPESAAAAPMWPWAEALRRLDPASDASLPEPSEAPGTHRLFEFVLGRLRQVAADRPVVIVLDDLQWADELTHQLLQLVIPITADEPLLVAVGLRDPFPEPCDALMATASVIARQGTVQRLPLAGLERAAVASLATAIVAETPADAVVAALWERTSGNPFFITELLRLLRAEHALHDADRMAAAGIPGGARDVIRRRVSQLPEQASVLLKVAAVVGRDIDARIVEHMTSVDSDELLDMFELATVAGLLSEQLSDPGIYRFTHDLVREALYETLPGLRRARLHARAVDALIAVHGDNTATAHELARHAVAAVPHTGPDPAVLRLSESARTAQRQLAVDLAEQQLRRGIALLADAPDSPERRRMTARLESRLAHIEFHIRGNRGEAATRLHRAREICFPDATDPMLEVTLCQASVAALWGDLAPAAAAANDALEWAVRLDERLAQSDAHYCLGTRIWSGAVADGLSALSQSVELAQSWEAEFGPPTGTHVPLATKRGLRAIALSLSGILDEARLERGESLGRAGRDGGWSLSWSGAFCALSAALGPRAGGSGENLRRRHRFGPRAPLRRRASVGVPRLGGCRDGRRRPGRRRPTPRPVGRRGRCHHGGSPRRAVGRTPNQRGRSPRRGRSVGRRRLVDLGPPTSQRHRCSDLATGDRSSPCSSQSDCWPGRRSRCPPVDGARCRRAHRCGPLRIPDP
jgi:DNA-binding SARP family transcriptional activator